MRKKFGSLLLVLLLTVLLVPAFTETAHAGDLDYIREYQVRVTPQAEDGSLRMEVRLVWEVLDEGPVNNLKIGIPNGSIRDVEALSDNIDYLDNDNRYMYVYFKHGYDTGAVFYVSYAWTQEYMYTVDDLGTVSYDYTPGWFDEARIGDMRVTWEASEDLCPQILEGDGSGTSVSQQDLGVNGGLFTATDLPHGAKINVRATYDSWPTELYWEQSAENLPSDAYDSEEAVDRFANWTAAVIAIIIVLMILTQHTRRSYRGGFGTRYVYVHGLWYPAGLDGKPRPGSTGTKTKPKPPRGGMGGGKRGGGFGGSGFGGGGHCACASSCACACACACAGGGRAGCSAKNLYGAVKLSRELTEKHVK